MTLRYSLFLLVFLVALMKCRKPEGNESKLDSASNDSSIVEEKTKQLVETILNLPGVVRFSKIELIQKEYETIFVYFNQNTTIKETSAISVKRKQLTQLHSLNMINTEERPCFVFTEIKIKNNDAYVYLTFDITGAIAYGNLKYTNGNWIPDKEFVTAVR